jgi:hypothetical protein
MVGGYNWSLLIFWGYATLQAAKSFMWLNVGNPHCKTSPFWQ